MIAFLKVEIAGMAAAAANGATVVLAVTDAVQVSIITSIAAVIMSCFTAYLAYKAKSTSDKTHDAVNSRLDTFMKTAEAAFRAEGVAKERAEERDRQGQIAQGAATAIVLPPALNTEQLGQVVDALKKLPPTL